MFDVKSFGVDGFELGFDQFHQFMWNLGDVAADAEKSKAVVATMLNRTKKRTMRMAKSNSKPAWGKLLSQCSQVESRPRIVIISLSSLRLVV